MNIFDEQDLSVVRIERVYYCHRESLLHRSMTFFGEQWVTPWYSSYSHSQTSIATQCLYNLSLLVERASIQGLMEEGELYEKLI